MSMQAVFPADDSRKLYNLYVERCNRYGYKILTFEYWQLEKERKEKYDEYLQKCKAGGVEPQKFKDFKKSIKVPSNDNDKAKKSEMTLTEYYNATSIPAKALESFVHSNHQLLRMPVIMEKLHDDPEIEDIVVYKDKNEYECSRGKREFIYILMNYARIKSSENEVVNKLVKYGKKFRSAKNKHTVLEFLTGGEGQSKDTYKQQTWYYCGDIIAQYIGDNAASLGLTKDGMAMYYFLLAVEGYDFGEEYINNEIARLLRKFDKKFNRKLEDLIEEAEEQGIDLSDEEDEPADIPTESI
jgi:hypothetical protein